MRSVLLPALAIALLAAPALADVQDAITQDPCPGAGSSILFAHLDERTENLAFDGAGHLYVTTIEGGLYRFAPDGTSLKVIDADRPLGGAAFGPDGALYVGYNVGVGVPLPIPPNTETPLPLVPANAAQVWRFADLPSPNHTVLAGGWNSSNGLAIDAAGNVYVSSGFEQEILRIAPDGSVAVWSSQLFPNGLALSQAGDAIYAALLFDPGSSVVRIPLADPAAATTELQFSMGALNPAEHSVELLPHPQVPLVPKGLDDLALGPEGRYVYVTAHLTGEVLRGDLVTRQTCLLAGGVPEATSARFATGFGAYDGALFVTNFAGDIRVVPVP